MDNSNLEFDLTRKTLIEGRRAPKSKINLRKVFSCKNYCKKIDDSPWIAARVEKCILNNTLGVELTDSRFCVLIDECLQSGNRFLFCVSDGRTKIPLKTTSNISENLKAYFDDQNSWTGFVMYLNTYRVLLLDANIILESEDYVLLEYDENLSNMIAKRSQWLRWIECIPRIATILRSTLSVEPFIPEDQKEDWRYLLYDREAYLAEIKKSREETHLIATTSNVNNHNMAIAPSLPSEPRPIEDERPLVDDETLTFGNISPITSTPRPSIVDNNELHSAVNGLDRPMDTIANNDNETQLPLSKTTLPSPIHLNGVNRTTENFFIQNSDSPIISSSSMKRKQNFIPSTEFNKRCKLTTDDEVNKSNEDNSLSSVMSKVSSDGVLDAEQIKVLRSTKWIRDENGKLYKLCVEPQHETIPEPPRIDTGKPDDDPEEDSSSDDLIVNSSLTEETPKNDMYHNESRFNIEKPGPSRTNGELSTDDRAFTCLAIQIFKKENVPTKIKVTTTESFLRANRRNHQKLVLAGTESFASTATPEDMVKLGRNAVQNKTKSKHDLFNVLEKEIRRKIQNE